MGSWVHFCQRCITTYGQLGSGLSPRDWINSGALGSIRTQSKSAVSGSPSCEYPDHSSRPLSVHLNGSTSVWDGEEIASAIIELKRHELVTLASTPPSGLPSGLMVCESFKSSRAETAKRGTLS